MPRKARLDAPGTLHHVMIRGIERRAIFLDDDDRSAFLARLAVLLDDTGTCCYAWSLMPNHAHMLIRTGRTSLSSFMARLLTGYAARFNRRHRRSGQLFQNRYKSIICEEDGYFTDLVRYIHLNPLRASIVGDLDSLARYSYCGHSAIMGKVERGWQDTEFVLSLFNGERKAYLLFVEQGITQGRRTDLAGGGLKRSYGGWKEIAGSQRLKSDERILGGSAFVQKILSEAEEQFHRAYAIKQKGHTLESVAEEIANLFKVTTEALFLRTKQRPNVEARSLLFYIAVNDLGVSITDLARRFGLTQPAVSYAVRRGRETARKRGYTFEGNL